MILSILLILRTQARTATRGFLRPMLIVPRLAHSTPLFSWTRNFSLPRLLATNYFLTPLNIFFPMSMVADLTKHLFLLGPEAIGEIAAILQVTVAPSTTMQSTAQSTFLKSYENADTIKKSLFTRGIARTDPSGGGVALILQRAHISYRNF